MTQLQQLKEDIENGASCIEAYEQVDLDQMRAEGSMIVAGMIDNVLYLTKWINNAARVE